MPRDARRLVCGGTPDSFDIYVTATDLNSENMCKAAIRDGRGESAGRAQTYRMLHPIL